MIELSSDFVPGEQADAHEFLRCFLDNLDSSSLNLEFMGNNKPSIDGKSIVKQVFGGCLRSQVLKPNLIDNFSTTINPFFNSSKL